MTDYKPYAWVDREDASLFHVPNRSWLYVVERSPQTYTQLNLWRVYRVCHSCTKLEPTAGPSHAYRWENDDVTRTYSPTFRAPAPAKRWLEDQMAKEIPDLERLGWLAKDNPTRKAEFTPSYEADSLEDYRRKVDDGDKRDLHYLVEGGRRAVRYGEGPDKQTPVTRKRRRDRWKNQTKPWDARTQSIDVREVSFLPPGERSSHVTPGGLTRVGQVAQALDAYRAKQKGGQLGLAVPTTPWPLIEAGVPKKIASILVSRAPGAFFPADGRQSVLQAPSLERQIRQVLPEYLSLRQDGRLVIGFGREGKTSRQAELQAVRLLSGRRSTTLFTAGQIKEAFDLFAQGIRRKDGRRYREELDRPTFMQAFYRALEAAVRAESERLGPGRKELALTFVSLGRQFTRLVSIGEHSISTPEGEAQFPVRYRNLQNVSLSDLPRLLVSIASRKKRKGRRTTPLARNNPVTNQDVMLQVVVKALAAGQLVPVPGKPGKVYWPVSEGSGARKRYVGLKVTTDMRAKSWMGIAKAGKRSAELLRETATESMRADGLSGNETFLLTNTQMADDSARENPMSYSDEDFWFSQYQQAPYGARQSIPAARRNPKKKKKSRAPAKARKPSAWNKMFGAIGKRAAQIQQSRGCEWGFAWKAAEAEIKGGARTNGLALKNGRYKARKNGLALKNGQSQAKAAMQLYHSGQASSLKEAWAIVKGGSRHNPKRHKSLVPSPYSKFSARGVPQYEQVVGQFGVSEAWSHGLQPVNRRNPAGGQIGRWSKPCCICGGETQGHPIAQAPGRGPRGGKLWAHSDCL